MPPRQRRSESEDPLPRMKLAKTPQGRENQMIDLADRLAEKQLREGNASAQVITHYLKLGSSREKLEQERIKHENALTLKKIDAMNEANRLGELMEKAISAFKSYTGEESAEGYEDFSEDPNVF